MRAIKDKVRYYRITFRPVVFYALTSSPMLLSSVLACLILGLFFWDLYVRLTEGVALLNASDQGALLLSETPLIFGMLQVYFEGAERRYRQLHPSVRRVSFRTSNASLAADKRKSLLAIFQHEGDLRSLAKSLIEEWEWRHSLKSRAQEPIWRKAIAFFRLPSAANFAAYMTGVLAVCAGIVIAAMSPDVVFASFPEFLNSAWSLIWELWLALVIPFAICVLPGAMILSTAKGVGELLIEKIDDQYLSDTAFYRFISELLELHDQDGSLFMRKTRAWIYWVVRLLICPLTHIPKVFRRVVRARALNRWVKSGRRFLGLVNN